MAAANQSYEPGQIILRSRPFAHVIEPNFIKRVCDFCFEIKEKDGLLKQCLGCNLVYYCNKSCQTEAWMDHREECKFLKDFNFPPNGSGHYVIHRGYSLVGRILFFYRIICKFIKGNNA